MGFISETEAITRLNKLKVELKALVRDVYENKAKDCITCETQGACCLDAHFVNVRITRLEAVAILRSLSQFNRAKQAEVYNRITEAIGRFGLEDDLYAEKGYACPLFERGTGCLVHNEGKPIPCILHACYENREDLPPESLLEEYEAIADSLDHRTYGIKSARLSLPVAITKIKRSF